MLPRLLHCLLLCVSVAHCAKWKTFKWKTMVRSACLNQSEGVITAGEKIGQPLSPITSEVGMSSVEIIITRGYPVEIHPVTTEDGYILMLHRIPRRRGQQSGTPGRPVFLQHGFIGSSADWIISPTERSLAFQLADKGYDVWLGNARGNDYSRSHVSLDPLHDDTYWEFSFDEMGRYDLPAALEYVLAATGKEKLIYIGNSMGTTMFFICMSLHPELNGKIELMMALAPVSTLAHMKSSLRLLVPFRKQIQFILELLRTRLFLSQTAPLVQLQKRFCTKDFQTARICQNILFTIVGADTGNIDLELLPTINSHIPAGTSVRTLAHFGQFVVRGPDSREKFERFNFGLVENLKRYGQRNPPAYNLSQITVPVHLFYGQADLLSTPKDVSWLEERLPNVQQSVLVGDPKFNHEDFLFATNVNRLLYNRVMASLPSP